MDGIIDRRFVSTLFLVGSALALLGNALHPIIDAGAGAEGLLRAATDTSYWVLLHLVIGLAVVILTAAVVMLMRDYAGTRGAATAQLTSVLALLGGTIFLFQIVAVDGAVMPALAADLADGADAAALMAAATAMQAFDLALLSIVTTVYFGAAFVALGVTAQRTATFAPWLRWTAIGAGAVGFVTGVLMYVGVAETLVFFAFRAVALAVTIVAIGAGVQLRRGQVPATTATTPPAAAPV